VDVGHGGRRVVVAVWIRAGVGICALGTERYCMLTTEMGDEVMAKRPAVLSTSAGTGQYPDDVDDVQSHRVWNSSIHRRHPLADEYLPSS